MIGKVVYAGGQVILEDDLTWRCPEHPPLAAALQSLFDPRQSSPADGAAGVKELHQAAEILGGRVILEPKTPPPPDAVF